MAPQKGSTKSPNSSKNNFSLNNLSMREFETFLIFLRHEGEELSVLKKFIDLSFDHTSRTKGYDYINILCRKGFAYKKTTLEKRKNVTRIFIRKKVRKEYERFILPTIGSIKESLKDVLEEYIDDLKDLEKIREKFRAYTETVILSISDLLLNEPVKTLNSKRFQKKLNDMIWRYFRAEMLKYEMFSK
jgi:hypothetical protein